ncbi:ATP-binding protein [Indiicoccus explosivorum]|uniref:ATP-binding protein n=1 Tax=Indiicoccus explosivorum TaxID=1917864 RepID=UPI001F4DE6EF|nr:ATP-binding protein [Indiicoccus explosivorum]
MSYQDMLNNFPKPEILNTYQCEGCGQDVQVTEMPIAGGPDKGKVEKFYLGCKCGDIILAEQAVEKDRQARTRHMLRLFDQNSLVNESLKKATFENYNPPSQELAFAKDQLKMFADNFSAVEPHSFMLKGTFGTGKSHLSYATAKTLLASGHSALFLSVPKLLTKIKDTYNSKSTFSEADLLELVGMVDLMVLDDLGAEYTNARNTADNWVWSKLFEVVDSRSGKSTIYTTNLSSTELETKVGTRNFSRIMDSAEIILMNGKDYRRKAF